MFFQNLSENEFFKNTEQYTMVLNKDIFNMICYFINYKNDLIDCENFDIENEMDNSNKKLNEIKKRKISKTNYDFFDNFSETIIDC